jgi:CheY-like chemotaxis protein
MYKTLLAMDDDLGSRSLLKFLFKDEYRLKICSDGLEAIEWLEQGNNPQIIISDMLMPEIHGLDFLRFIRNSALYQNIPLIFLSGLDDDEIIDYAYQEGASLYLKKPYNPFHLKNQVANLLTKPYHAESFSTERRLYK